MLGGIVSRLAAPNKQVHCVVYIFVKTKVTQTATAGQNDIGGIPTDTN